MNKKSALRFELVGGCATVIDFGILNLLSLAGLGSLPANTIATGLAMIFSFLLNKKFTFHSESKNYIREIVLFVTFTLFGLWVIQNLIIQGLLSVLPSDWSDFWRLNAAKVIATVASMTWNYVTYAKVVFRKKPQQQSRPTESE
ncbi:MAG: GtrA family protein [Candidatus Nomurabacteria bacterium]|jgi:putative flippase GtrA|nr:GtrA family protein [Candidatus Nomurabacteria bacterium]